MTQLLEKRRHPRLDTSRDLLWKIKVFGLKGRPLEGQIVNVSMGGVAFVGHWKYVAKTVKRFTTRVEIHMPDGHKIDANTNLVRIRPRTQDDRCVCVLELTDLDNQNTSRLRGLFVR